MGFKRILENTRTRRILYSFIGAIIWCAIVIPVIITRQVMYSGDSKVYIPEGKSQDDFEGISFSLNFQSVDSAARKVNLYSHIFVTGNYSDEFGALKQNITCNLRYAKANLIAGNLPEPLIFTIPILEGSVEDYPFEVFSTFFPILCKDSDKNTVPTALSTEKDLNSYVPSLIVDKMNNLLSSLGSTNDLFKGYYSSYDSVGVFIVLNQSKTSIILSLFIMIVMWGLAISYSITIYDIIRHRREFQPPVIAIGVSMLFALPALRNSQPGVPLMGCISDVVSFFWCIAIIALDAMFILFAFALRWRKPKLSSIEDK